MDGRQGRRGLNLGRLKTDSGAQFLSYLRQKNTGAFNTRPGRGTVARQDRTQFDSSFSIIKLPTCTMYIEREYSE